MKTKMMYWSVFTMAATAMVATLLIPAGALQAGEKGDVETAVPVTMTVTASVDEGKRMPEIQKDDVFVRKGKERLQVTGWVPAKGDRAGLELFILIDDAADSSLGSQLRDLRTFISAQPATTAVGVGYMRNATVQVVQNLTTDHEAAAKALRLPIGSAGAYGSPYLSVVDLMKRWPEGKNRREIILISDGVDRAHRGRNAMMNPDVDTAFNVAQRTGTIIHSIYTPGVGQWRRNYWEAWNGQNAMSKLSDITGGEAYFLGIQSPVSFTPYLEKIQKALDNQYLLTFLAKPEKKAGLLYVNVSTEIAGVDLESPDAVWVPAAK